MIQAAPRLHKASLNQPLSWGLVYKWELEDHIQEIIWKKNTKGSIWISVHHSCTSIGNINPALWCPGLSRCRPHASFRLCFPLHPYMGPLFHLNLERLFSLFQNHTHHFKIPSPSWNPFLPATPTPWVRCFLHWAPQPMSKTICMALRLLLNQSPRPAHIVWYTDLTYFVP